MLNILKFTLSVVLLMLVQGHAFGQKSDFNNFSSHETVTGIIQKISRHSIDICDESDGRIKRFIYLHDHYFQSGDRVRVVYDVPSNVIQRIKKMTNFNYQQETQNLGYLMHQGDKRCLPQRPAH